MSWFKTKEAMASGDFVMRIMLSDSDSQTVIFTLDSAGETRMWQLVHIGGGVGDFEDVDATVSDMMNRAMDAVTRAVPSLAPGQLVVGIESGRTGGPEIVAHGPASFVASEWKALTALARSKTKE